MSKLDSIQQSARAQFDKQSHLYGKGHILENVEDVKAALEAIHWKKSGKALDVATGSGHTGLYLASLGLNVFLSDLSRSMLKRARDLAKERGFPVEVLQHAAEELPYRNGSFDLVTCRVAAHHFSSPFDFIRESSRILKPGGIFLLIDGSVEDSEPEAAEWLHQVEKLRDPSHHRFRTPGEWKEFCRKAGLLIHHLALHPLKQPDLNWYFETAATSPENRRQVLELIETAPESARRLFRLSSENGKIVWWWQRLSLVAEKPGLS